MAEAVTVAAISESMVAMAAETAVVMVVAINHLKTAATIRNAQLGEAHREGKNG